MKNDNIVIHSIRDLDLPDGIHITVKPSIKLLPKTYFEDTKAGTSKKVNFKSLHNGGFWLIEQQGESRPFITCNPAYIKAYNHLFISCQFIKLFSYK